MGLPTKEMVIFGVNAYRTNKQNIERFRPCKTTTQRRRTKDTSNKRCKVTPQNFSKICSSVWEIDASRPIIDVFIRTLGSFRHLRINNISKENNN